MCFYKSNINLYEFNNGAKTENTSNTLTMCLSVNNKSPPLIVQD